MRQHPIHNTEDGLEPARTRDVGIDIRWQHGAVTDDRLNGAMIEGVILAVISRLEEVQLRVPHEGNKKALVSLYNALQWLEARTRDRARRGVLGTMKP